MSSNPWDDITLPSLEAKGLEGESSVESQESQEPQGICRSNVQALIQLCQDLGVQVFQDKGRGDWFVRFPSRERRVIERLRSENFKGWLSSKFFRSQGVAPSPANLDGAFSILTGEARYGADDAPASQKVFLRLGEWDGKFYLDLGNAACQVVEIDAAGWRILDDCPLWFWRHQSLSEIPAPEKGGDLSLLREFVNADEDDFQLICGWLVAALNPAIEYPILAIVSEAGSGKSTLTTFLKELIDPDAAGAVSPFKNPDALFAAASSRHVVALDNLSSFSKEDSDHFCRLATGAGVSQRRLYTNNESFDIRLRRPVILNGIDFTPDKTDILDRCFPVSLKPLADRRRGGRELRRAFEEARPRILGALLSAVSAALRKDNYNPRHGMRMSDAVTFIMRAAEGGAMPFSPEAFNRALAEKAKAVMLESVLNNPVGNAIYNLALAWRPDGTQNWTAEELLGEVRKRATEQGWSSRVLPQSPKALGKALSNLLPALRMVGVGAVKGRDKYQRYWTFQYTGRE